MDTYCTKSELINEYTPIRGFMANCFNDAILLSMASIKGIDGTFIYVLN